MPIVLSTQRQFRSVLEGVPFCYLCGGVLPHRGVAGSNKDHVPPKRVFRAEHRTPPLQLRTHEVCNNSHSENDAISVALIDILHGQRPPQPRFEAGVQRFADGSLGLAVGGFDMRAIVRRWVRGFHAALYAEYLPDGVFASTITPLPEANRQADGTVTFGAVPAGAPGLVEVLKKNRELRLLDGIVAYNEKCRYECVWVQADRGEWMCVWALDVYGWIERLGDREHFEPRGCFGVYRRSEGGSPAGAAEGTRLEFTVANREPLDPFGG